jgi:NAD(P)-dependent dehydrogenase (short-subunit alcohol dehydrogenase family)
MLRDPTLPALQQLLDLSGRVAVVTGGARGIGFAAARRLAEAGAATVLADRDAGAASDAAARLGPAATSIALDVTDGDSICAGVQRVSRELGRVDVWVNNAGIYPSAPLWELTDEDFDGVLSVNLRGMFIAAREVSREMAANAGGVIINVASTAAHGGWGPGIAHYTSSKHGVIGLTKALAVELGPLGIRVVAISPQYTRTEGMAVADAQLADAGLPDMVADLTERTPLRRVGEPDDVARVILFAASDLGGYVTGSHIPVDGGLLAVG